MIVEEQELKPRRRIYVPSKTKADVPIPATYDKIFVTLLLRNFGSTKLVLRLYQMPLVLILQIPVRR